MNIHDIVAGIYTDKRVNEFISKQRPVDLQGDLLHHCITEIYRLHEKYPGKIERLHESNQLWPFFHGMVCQQLYSEKSTFFTRYRRPCGQQDVNGISIYEEPPKDAQEATFKRLVARLGYSAAIGAMKELERQEMARITDYGEKKVLKFKQKELF